MSQVLLFALTAAFNPTLLAATTVMLMLPNPRQLLVGYLLGAMMTSVSLGLLIVFELEGSGAVDTQENTISPAADLVLGGLLLAIAFVLATGRHERLAERRRAKKADKPETVPRWQQALSKGSARSTFVVGALLTLPGASYLVGLRQIDDQNLSTPQTVLTVVGFNLIMLALLELPLIGYTFAPDWTPVAVQRFRAGLTRHGGRILTIVAAVLGAALVARGLIGLL